MTCNICKRKQVCEHDEKCPHNVLINRRSCERCATGQPPSPYYLEQQRRKQYVYDFNVQRAKDKLPPLPVPAPKKQRNFALSDEAYVGLLQLARELGYVHDSSRAPNPTQLVEAIGQGLLVLYASV